MNILVGAGDILKDIESRFIPDRVYAAQQLRELAVEVKAIAIRRSGRESLYEALEKKDESLEKRIPDSSSQGSGMDIYFIETNQEGKAEAECLAAFHYVPEQGYFFERASRNTNPQHWVSRL